MPQLHYFNPDNDLALAANVPNYTAPMAAVKLRQAGAVLPMWYGEAGDKMLCYGVNQAWFERKQGEFGIDVDVYNHSDLLDPSPWGWSIAARQVFEDEGLPAKVLPTDRELDTMRELSHRRTSIMVVSRLAQVLGPVDRVHEAVPVEALDIEQARRVIAEMGSVMVKMPWSSSGRGVVANSVAGSEMVDRLTADSIRRQGSVIVEPYYRKRLDFAKIFSCNAGKCQVIGTSVFDVDKNSSYSGNVLASEERRLAVVGEIFPIDILEAVTEALRGIIEECIAPYYNGILGIDMLIDEDGKLDPVVEVNLRKTMGYVAILLSERYVMPDATGTLRIMPLKIKGQRVALPPEEYCVRNNRMVGGTLYLTPPNMDFAFQVSLDQ